MTRPNVLLIVADDMGYGDLGRFNPAVSTPHLDQMTDQGICLRQHYTASPICAPARAGLLTGRYPHRTGAITQHEIHGLDRIGLDERTIADSFRHAGYATGLIGKWHNGTFDPRFEPNARGFEEFVGFCGGWMDYYQYKLRYNDTYVASNGRYMTDLLTDEAIGFIGRHHQSPFFLQLAYSAPHSPFQAPQRIVDKYLGKGFNRIVATTYAMIEIMDHGIGNVLQCLQEHGLDEKTIVLFTSDNGPAFFNPSYMLEPGESTLNERFNCGYKGAKGYVAVGGIRVPMILRYPGHLPAGQTSDALFHFTDWLPTLTQLAGVPRVPGPALDGHDVTELLLGRSPQQAPRQFWQWNFYMPHIGTNAAMRDGPWKLVRPTISGTRFFNKDLYASPEDVARMQAFVEGDLAHKLDPEQPRELVPVPQLRLPPPEPAQLYRLDTDPGEQHDLAAQHPERVSRMLRQLEAWFEDVEADRLRTLGPAVSQP
jgi:arylsulfatase A-like enzyme